MLATDRGKSKHGPASSSAASICAGAGEQLAGAMSADGRAHVLPTIAHQTTCLSVNHCDILPQLERRFRFDGVDLPDSGP